MTTPQRVVWIVYVLLIAFCGFAAAADSHPLGSDTRVAIVLTVAGSIIAGVLHCVVRPARAAGPQRV